MFVGRFSVKMEAMKEDQIRTILERGVSQIIERSDLEKLLRSGKKLRVKLGIDPTAPDLHLGHAVVLRKLRQFQDAGHKVVLIIGDFTAQIGDPSGKSKTRPALSESDVKKNMKTFLAQAGKVIDVKKAEIRRNSEWYKKGGIRLLLSLAQASTVQQVLKREDFRKRIDEGNEVSLLETLYAVLQGYDSVAVKADVELGGDDQRLNLLSGRRIQRHFDMAEQQILTTPLLVGLDGTQKMSKSLGNYVGLTFAPDDMFGKIMSLPDANMREYFELCTDLTRLEVEGILVLVNPRDTKKKLAFEIVKLYHGERSAKKAEESFTKTFSKKEVSGEGLPEFKVKRNKLSVLDLILSPQTTTRPTLKSKGEAQRLISQGGVRINRETKKNFWEIVEVKDGDVFEIGKHHFFRIKIQ